MTASRQGLTIAFGVICVLLIQLTPASAFGSKDASTNQCGGIAGMQCPKDTFCQYEMGTCGAADQMGTCEPQRLMCTRDYRPVCGCDGKTYGNACTAGAAAVSIAYEGECREE